MATCKIATIKTSEEFKAIISSENLSVIIFTADFAEQCKVVKDSLEELIKVEELSSLNLHEVYAEELTDVSLKCNIDAVPTTLFFKNGQIIDRVDGANVAEVSTKLKKHSTTNVTDSKSSLEDKLTLLINKHNVMVFMKGDRHTPKCGFSNQLITILNENSINYDTFDILTDEAVRQGLKTFSDWPTYPQVYVKGDLVGGLDIVKELIAADEFKATMGA